MPLSSELVSELVKVTTNEVEIKNEATVYGTIVEYEGSKYVRLDGSDLLTPIYSTTDAEADERVTVLISNHKAVVTGNMSSPAARTGTVQEIGTRISEAEILIADKVSTKYFDAEVARIDELTADNVTIKGELNAQKATIDELEANDVTINGTLTAHQATIESLETSKLSAKDADIKYATITNLDATNAEIHNLEADYGEFVELTAKNFEATNANISDLEAKKLTAEDADLKYATIEGLDATNIAVDALSGDYGEFKHLTAEQFTAVEADIEELEAKKLTATDADLKYANIDFSNIGKAAIEEFFAQSGLIEDVIVGDGTITGNLVGVTISGDLIEGNTIVAEKLVIKGTDGLYYALNTDGVTTETEQTDYNSLNGSVIKAKSITATKISVKDLVAFDATIGGFKITDNSIYSGAKESVNNTTRGIYMDNDGQIVFGDANNFIKFYKDTDGTYKLAISASSMTFGSSNTSIESAIEELKDEITTNLRIDSSRGTVFKNNSVSTVLSAVIYRGSLRITDITALRAAMGNSAYLQWKWQRLDDETFGVISASDSRIGNDGFTLTLTPADVDTKVTFMCELIV